MIPSVVALLPMRHSSERVPGKNYRLLAGRPLYHHVLRTLLTAEGVDRVVIDTDSDTIRSDAAEHFPQVQVLERPAHLRSGDTPMNDVLLNDLDRVPADWYLQTHSTNPFLRADTIDNALARFFGAFDEFDSAFGATRLQARLWTSDARPINHDPEVLLRTQDLAPVYLENSCLYVFSGDSLRKRGNRIGERPMIIEVDPAEAIDIDEERDFALAERLATAR